MPAKIFEYVKPEDLVRITLDGIDQDLRFMDSLFLFVAVISAYLLLPYIPFIKLKYFSKRNTNAPRINHDAVANTDLNILGFTISRKQIFYITVITTLIHLSLGITIKSKTDLIIETSKTCDSVVNLTSSNKFPYPDSIVIKSSENIKKQIAENYAYQSLSNSRLFQIFNYKKMYLTAQESSYNIADIFSVFILLIPFLLFTFFFVMVGFEWLAKVDQRQKQKKTFKLTVIFIVFGMNICSFCLWIGGIKHVADLIYFGYNLPFLKYLNL